MVTLTCAAIVIVAILAHRAGGEVHEREGWLARALASRGALGLVFVVTFATLWYSWGAVDPVPVVHDEMAYVLQAKIFARGTWTLPSPALPAFWEQPYILLKPALAAKYFPGHALLLALGAFVGWMPLIPLLLQSAAGCLLYVLARRVSCGGVAFLAWVVWLFTPMVLYFGPSYYSEATTTVCWLAGWYALLEWRQSRTLAWIAVLAAFVGWGAITRPLTGLAYAIPVGVVVMRDVVTAHRWRDLIVAFVVGALVMSILPVWSAHTTGDWRVTPLSLYTREYMPYDVPGFGLAATPPAHALTPEMARLNDVLMASHVGHTPASLPGTLVSRAHYLWDSIWGVSSGALGVFAVLGLLTLTSGSAFAVGSSVWLLLVYLTFATPAKWTLYYYESVPAFAFLTASGVAWAASLLGRPRGAPSAASHGWLSHRYTGPLAVGALVLALPGLAALRLIHVQHLTDGRVLAQFSALLSSVPGGKSVMFVRYAADHDAHVTFVRNSANAAQERIWVVYDRGEIENAQFLDHVPDRKAYLFDEAQGRTYSYDPRSVP